MSEQRPLPTCGKVPCGSCPYRKDVPAGVWAAHEYEKLPAYDGTTTEQLFNGAFGLFYCHQQDGKLCAGWVGCHDMEESLAVRFNGIADEAYDYQSPVPLWSSGAEAAAHGLSGVDDPSDEAVALIDKLDKKLGDK